MERLALDHQAILNVCAKLLARHRGAPAEAWRFPVVESSGKPGYNRVTFIISPKPLKPGASVGVVGTFHKLYQALPCEPVRFLNQDTQWLAASFEIPCGEVHHYRFCIDGECVNDPVNPQRSVRDNGESWSRFFTDYCTQPVTFEHWEQRLLKRLVTHVLPFCTSEGERFLDHYYHHLDARRKRDDVTLDAHKLDESVGEVNYLDKLLAREERHRLSDYRVCLRIIDQLMRKRFPYCEIDDIPKQHFVDLLEQMQRNHVPDWNIKLYPNPQSFVHLLRRHVVTGAFCHPCYGGNIGYAGWAFLEERYRTMEGRTLFDWRRSQQEHAFADTPATG